MLISPGLLECPAEPVRKDGPNRRNREPSALFRFSPSSLLLSFSLSSSPSMAGMEVFFVRLFSNDRSIHPSLADGFYLPSRPPLARARTRGVAPRSNINFAATTFRHPPFLPLRDPYGNGDRSSESSLPVWETSPTGREREKEGER